MVISMAVFFSPCQVRGVYFLPGSAAKGAVKREKPDRIEPKYRENRALDKQAVLGMVFAVYYAGPYAPDHPRLEVSA
jgi:hypothetical protein